MFISFLHFADLYSPRLPICLISENLTSLFESFHFTPSIELPGVFFICFRIPDYWLIWLLFFTLWSSVTKSCLTLCNPMNCSTPGIPVLHHRPEFAETHVHWVSDAIHLSHPLSLLSPLALNLSQHQGFFFSELVLHIRCPKYWSFSSSPSNEYSVLISFRIDWFDLFAVQGTLKSLLQHPNSKVSVLLFSAFTMKYLSTNSFFRIQQ